MPRKNIEMAIPHPEDYENLLDYIAACGQARADYNAACARLIDSRPEIRREQPKKRAMQTAHDFLQEHPYMRERYKKHGAMAFLDSFGDL
jgi:transposase